MEPKEINREIKAGLDAFLLEDDPAVYRQPVETEQELFTRGLLGDDGQATIKGELFVELQDRGIFDENGAFTERGRSYALTEDELGEEENWRRFKLRAEDGIDDTDVPLGEVVGQVGGYVMDAGKGMGKRLVQEAQSVFYNSLDWKSFVGQADNRPDWLKAQMAATGAGVIEGGMEAMAQLGTLADVGQGKASELMAGITGEDAIAEENLWKAKQRQWKTYKTLEALEAGDIAENVLGMAGVVDQLAQAKDTLGKEEFDSLYKQSRAGGNLFLDPTNVLAAGVATKAATKAPLVTRLQLSADRILARRMGVEARLAALGTEAAAAQRVATTAGTASKVAAKLADDLALRAEQTGDQVILQRSRQAADIAARTNGQASKAADELVRITGETEQLAATAAKLATRLPETAAAALNRTIQIGRQIKAAPAVAVGSTLEKVGRGITRLDEGMRELGSRIGVGPAYEFMRSGVGQSLLYGGGLAFGPVPAAIGAAGTVLRSGSRIEQLGKFSRIIGKEMTKARGQVPFWQRVGNYADLSPIHRATSKFMSHVEMGGALPGAIRRTGRGVVAAYPVDLSFEYLAQGGEMNENTLKQAFAESLVIGGSSAALGGAFMGSKARHKQLAIGDELNFRAEMTDPTQRTLFDAVPTSTRRALATYAAIHPNLQFRFTNNGPSFYSGGVVNLNVASTNPLRALAAHEVMHHVVIRNQMEEGISALLIGDGESGGLLRGNDGTLAPDFQEFVDAYNARRAASQFPPANLGEIAVEYYIEQSADRVADMAESGELGLIASKTDLRRAIDKVIEATLPRLPIIRSLHFNLGGLMDQEGRLIMGNGLLSDGIRELPQVKAMTRRMLRAGSGRAIGGFDPMGGDRSDDSGGVTLSVAKGDKVILDKLISIFATEEVNGQTRVKYDQNGDPIMLDPATDAARSKIGLAIAEIANTLGREIKPGELAPEENGTWTGTHIPADIMRGLESRGILNKEQMRILKNINSATKNFTGDRFMVINHPATKKIGKKVRYATLAPTLRDVVPVGISVTKDGNLIVSLMSVTQLEQNIQTRAASKRGKKLYNGDTEAIRADLAAVMELHRQNQATDGYFREKYGAERGDEHKNFINTVFGLVGGEAQRGKNPMFAEDNMSSKTQVFRTYRVDRISQATRMTGDTTPMPFSYGAVKINLMPNGLPRAAEQITPEVISDTP